MTSTTDRHSFAPRHLRRLPFVLLAVVAALSIGASACSSSKKSSSNGTTSSTVAPEKVKLPIAQVLAKLPDMVGIANRAATEAAAGDFDKAKTTADGIEGVWSQVEGTVKDRSSDTYIAVEDAQARIKKGVDDKKADEVQAGAKAQADAVTAFVAKNPS